MARNLRKKYALSVGLLFVIASVCRLAYVVELFCAQVQRDTGAWYWAEYSTFSISDETAKYRLTVAGYCGDASDAMAAAAFSNWMATGMMFSTPDSDNDVCPDCNCASHSGWWMAHCSANHLTRDSTNAIWTSVAGPAVYDVVFSRMLVRLN